MNGDQISYFPVRFLPDGGRDWAKVGKNISISETLAIIKRCTLSKEIAAIRAEPDYDKQNLLKEKTIPFVTFPGSFSYREKKSIKQSAGLMPLDADDIEQTDFKKIRSKLEKDKFTRILYNSPRDFRLKLVFAIPECLDDATYKKYFYAAQEYLFTTHKILIDDGGSDICRASFLSADENIFFNSESEIFDKIRDSKMKIPGNGKAPKLEPGATIPVGSRNSTLIKLAGKLRRDGLSADEIAPALEVRNQNACNPPLTPAEVEGIAKSVARYEPAPVGLNAQDPNALPLLTTLSAIPPVPVNWLWENFIPIGATTLISGDPDAGKTWFTLDIAARVSRGTKWIDGSNVGNPGNVIYLTVEDEPGNTIHPRIITLGGDPDRLKVLTPNQPIYLNLAEPGGLERLEKSIIDFDNVRLVVLDPVADFSGRTNANANDEVRKLLTPLIDMASRLQFALVLIGHLNKTIAKQMYKAAGSAGGWIGKCRAAFTVLKDPNNEDEDMRFFAVVKNNLATQKPPLIEFKITRKDGWSARVSESAVNVDVALNPQLGRKPRERESTLDWLKELFDGRDNIPAAEIIEKAHERGTSTKTLQRAKKDGKYGSDKQRTPEGIWIAVWTKNKQVELFDEKEEPQGRHTK